MSSMRNESKSWSFDFTSPISISSIFGETGRTWFGVKWFSLLRDDDLETTLLLFPFEFLNELSEFEGNLRLGDADFRVVLVLLGKWWYVEVILEVWPMFPPLIMSCWSGSFLKLFCRTMIGELARGLFLGVVVELHSLRGLGCLDIVVDDGDREYFLPLVDMVDVFWLLTLFFLMSSIWSCSCAQDNKKSFEKERSLK